MSVRNKGKWIVATCVLALLLFVGVGVTSISSTQAWDFETDTVPTTKYDENEKEVYQETKLYAKWEEL